MLKPESSNCSNLRENGSQKQKEAASEDTQVSQARSSTMNGTIVCISNTESTIVENSSINSSHVTQTKSTDKDVDEIIAQLVVAFVLGPCHLAPLADFRNSLRLFTLLQPPVRADTTLAIETAVECEDVDESMECDDFAWITNQDCEPDDAAADEDEFVFVDKEESNHAASESRLVVQSDEESDAHMSDVDVDMKLMAEVKASLSPLAGLGRCFYSSPPPLIRQIGNHPVAVGGGSRRVGAIDGEQITGGDSDIPRIEESRESVEDQAKHTAEDSKYSQPAPKPTPKPADPRPQFFSKPCGSVPSNTPAREEDLLQLYAQMSSLEAIAIAIVDACKESGQGRRYLLQTIIRGLHPDRQNGGVGNKIIAERVAKIANTIKNHFTEKNLWGKPDQWRSHIKFLSRDQF